MSEGLTEPTMRIGDKLVAKGLLTQGQLLQALQEQKEKGCKLGEVILGHGWISQFDFYATLVDQFRKGRIGDLLVADGLLTQDQLQQALDIQQKWGSRLGDVILSKGWLQPFVFYQALARHFDRDFINLVEDELDLDVLRPENFELYSEHLFVPWRRENGVLKVAVADITPEILELVETTFDEPVDFVITSKFDIIWTLQSVCKQRFNDKSVYHLRERDPRYSASQVFTPKQLYFVFAWGTASALVLSQWALEGFILLNAMISLFLLCNFGLRVVFTWLGTDAKFDNLVTDEDVAAIDDRDLPIYTILIPMYKEAATIHIIAEAMRNLDYPLSKLDIKLILEEDDDETIDRAKELGLEGIYEIIRVPHSLPKTKPKACNYALNFARGKYVTIYDGEDAPEPDQLKKAVISFARANDNVAVIQARLNYFNVKENWLTRMFTMEYSLWFDFYLPALDKLGIPIPLGGTSNHFRMDILKEMNGWDPFNVTEDADLGVRLTQRKYHVGVMNSTTYEEANNEIHNWIRQRSRWLKGYMQTYLVHMRYPLEFYKKLGHVGFWGFQFFIGGTILSVLLAPILMGMYIFWLITKTTIFAALYPPAVLYINLFNLLIANGFLIYLYMLSVFKRHHYSLIPYALTVPVYWVLMSWAAYKGLWQLIHNPFYWEKTNHALTSYTTTYRVGEGEGDTELKSHAPVKGDKK